jgi:hypothetical protein
MKKILFLIIISNCLVMSQTAKAQTTPLLFNEVTLVPVFLGGQSKLNEFVSQNFITPDIEGITGLIKISFVIEIDGSLTNIKITQNLGSEFESAAKNVFLKSPKWIPGELNGEKVRVLMNYPINIR